MSVSRLARDKKRWYFSFYFEGKKYKKEIWNGKPMISKAEAIQGEFEFRQQLEHQKELQQGNMTLYELYDDFVSKTKSNLKDSSLLKYKTFKREYLSLIKDANIHELTQNDILSWIKSIKALNIGIETKNKNRNIFKSMLEFGSIAYNLSGKLQMPLLEPIKDNKIVVKDERSKYITNEDFNYMLSFLNLNVESDYYYYVIFNLLYYGGMRIGELAALTIDDFKDSTLTINKAYARIERKDVIQTPKTKNSVRKVVLDPHTNNLLLEYIERFKPTSIIFSRQKKYLTQQRVREKLSQIAQASELDKKYIIKIHSLRHSHSSNLRELGFDIFAISDRLGNTPQIASQVYTHTTADEQQQIAKKLRK